MKKFKNLTKPGNEQSVKIGSTAPSDSANIALFSEEKVTSSNSLVVVDLSETIQENRVLNFEESQIMFANELGVLEDINGNSNIPSSNISISDISLSREYKSESLSLNEINPNDYMHSYYVSRYFIYALKGFSIYGIEDIVSDAYQSKLNIKVLNEKGQDYVDLNTGRKKYKILLEPFDTEENSQDPEIPHRIIVGFDSSPANNLKLVYDKIEANSDGKGSNLHLSFSEVINAVPYFENLEEESLVMDSNNRKRNSYSIKKYNEKHADIFKKSITQNGYQVFVPKKALADNRVFEVFNWRLIAKSKQAINLDLLGDADTIEGSNNVKSRIVNVAVLYDSYDTNAAVYPYVFYQLENSPFNFSKFVFQNPISNLTQKNTAEYWKVDIQSISSLKDFDFVVFSPANKLSEKAYRIIDDYIKNHNGTILVDGSQYGQNVPFMNPNISITALSSSNASYYEYNTNSKVLNEEQNGGWNIDSTIFEKDIYGIFGKKKNRYKFINSVDNSKAILKVGTNSADAKAVAALYEYPSVSDALVQSNIIFTTFELLHYCNAVFNAAGDGSLISSNNGVSAFTISQNQVLSGLVEGPYKFLYNSIAFALYCRSYASRVSDTRSLIYNYVGEWNSSWTMFSDAILEDEKNQYFTNISSNVNEVKWGRDLIPGFASLESYYKKLLTDALPDYQKDKVSKLNLSQVEYYIEITNPDVQISTASEILIASVEENIPSAYYLKKISDSQLKPFAYTDKYSPSIEVPGDFGPYVIKEVSGVKSSDTKKLVNYIDPVTQFNSYPFMLQTDYSYISATDKPLLFNGSYNAKLKMYYKGKVEPIIQARLGNVVRNWKEPQPDKGSGVFRNTDRIKTPSQDIPGVDILNIKCINFKSSVEKNLYAAADSSRPYNNFIYTGDINLGNSTNSWSTAYSGRVERYVKFLQVAMKATGRYGAGNFASWPVDGKYGEKTEKAIRDFQQKQRDLGNIVLYVDGIVDSETKSLIHKRLLALSVENPEKYNEWRNTANTYGVLDYWDASVGAGTIESLNQGKPCKKISFTGFAGPGAITDIIYFQIPDGSHTVNKLKIDFGYWKNVTVTTYGWSSVDYSESIGTSDQRLANYSQRVVNATPDDKGLVTINLPDLPLSSCRYMYIRVHSNAKLKSLNGIFGDHAEGYALETIMVDGKSMPTKTEPVYEQEEIMIPQPKIDVSRTYEAVDSLTAGPDPVVQSYLNRDYYSGKLFYDYSQNKLKSNTLDHRVFVRGTTDGYYRWNGSDWVKEVIPAGADENTFIEDFYVREAADVDVVAEATTSETFVNLSPTNSITSVYDSSSVWSKNLTFNKITYTYKNVSYTHDISGGSYKLSSGEYVAPGTDVKFNFGEFKKVELKDTSSVQITSLKDETGTTMPTPLSVVSVEYMDPTDLKNNLPRIIQLNKVVFSTSSTYYSGSSIVVSPRNNISPTDYTCVSLDGRNLGSLKSVTVNDGIVLITRNSDNKPYGIPSYSSIASLFAPLANNEERDIRLGYISVYNLNKAEDGFIYGFYDKAQNEFIGTVTSYIDILNRGLNNVYIAVCAIDADGNTQNKIDYIGPKVSMTFRPVNVPLKKVYPIYSVKINSNSRIKIGSMSFDFEKKQAWPLPITQGSFIKKIFIDSNIYSGWKINYLNQELLCTYDTHNIPGANYSKIFGKGYYDIVDENPLIISESAIKVRQAPFIVWPEPSSYASSKVGLIRPQFEVYTNSNTAAQNPSQRIWEKIPFNKIKNYNGLTGVIEFTEKLVPQNEIDIKISYVAKNNDVQIYQVDGNEIPLNPLLNKEKMQTDKSLYVYIMPTKIEKRNNIISEFSSYEKVTEYTNTSPVNFTYDKEIFNPSSHKYDPFALLIGMVIYTKSNNNLSIYDTRLRGGGVRSKFNLKDVVKTNPSAISYWDMYPSEGLAYPKGGYIIIKLPNEVKNNFQTVQEIYDIVYRNMTAGVSFEIQDMDGNPYGVE